MTLPPNGAVTKGLVPYMPSVEDVGMVPLEDFESIIGRSSERESAVGMRDVQSYARDEESMLNVHSPSIKGLPVLVVVIMVAFVWVSSRSGSYDGSEREFLK